MQGNGNKSMGKAQIGRILGGALWAVAGTALAQAQASATASKSPQAPAHSRHASGAMPPSARNYYAAALGVDELTAQLAESGQLVRVSYRIVDARLAKPLLDKASNPTLLDERRRAVLSVPSMEKVGALRQSGEAEPGKTYWVLFSNRGAIVQAGDRVSVVIGSSRIDGLIVEK